MNLGVYITAKDEELLIRPCVERVLKVFPQAELIDIGSQDSTLEIAGELLPCHKHAHMEGSEYTALKRELSSRHDWVFWIDGDEIYPHDSLLSIKKRIENPSGWSTINVLWRNLRVGKNGKVWRTRLNPRLMARSKAFDVSKHNFKRAWPREVVENLVEGAEGTKEPRQMNGIWCWHGVLLRRTTQEESTARRKKREVKVGNYIRDYDWVQLDEFPWDDPREELYGAP